MTYRACLRKEEGDETVIVASSSCTVKGIQSFIVYVTKRKSRLPYGPFEKWMPEIFASLPLHFMAYLQPRRFLMVLSLYSRHICQRLSEILTEYFVTLTNFSTF